MESIVRKLQKVSAEGNRTGPYELGDFTTTKRVIFISIVAMGIGILSAFVALALLRLIGLFTNLFFFQRRSTTRLHQSEILSAQS